jgi:hypothetical protein
MVDRRSRDAEDDPISRLDLLVESVRDVVEELDALSEQIGAREVRPPTQALAAVEEARRRGALYDVFLRHLPEGSAWSWSEVFDGLSDEEWREIARILDGRSLVDVLRPPEQPRLSTGRRRRWSGRAQVGRPSVVVDGTGGERTG